MVYTAAYNSDNEIVAYLITSDYFYDQKSWVPASAVQFISSDYGMQTVNISGAYEWVCKSPIDDAAYKISGQYTNSYFPILETVYSDNAYWYKIPVSLDSNTNSYGYILKSESNAYISSYSYKVSNTEPVIKASNKTITEKQSIDLLEEVEAVDNEDGNITNKIQISGSVNIEKVGRYEIVYSVTDSGNLTTTKKIIVEVVEDQVPVITASDREINLNSEFNPLLDVTATDNEDEDIIKNIKVIKNNVDTTKIGKYEVSYQVTDSYGHVVTKNIVITVTSKEKEQKEGLYYFNYLKVVDKKLQIKGYHAIRGLDHNENSELTYKLVFVNLDSNEEYVQEAERISNKDEFERPVYSNDSYDYTYSWFKANIDIDSLPDGDYQAYIITENSDYYAKTIISNKVLKEQVSTYKSKKTLTTRNNYRDSNIPLEFIIRSEEIADKSATSTFNQYSQFRTFKFVDNKLRIMGTSYSIGMDLSKDVEVERKIIFENIKTYKKYTYNVGSITEGLYQVGTTLEDDFDKTRAWFDTSMDLSKIEKGEYAIYISTKSNISDYGELNELLFRSLDDVILEQDGKKYSFRINKNLRYRIELIVE